MGKDDGQKRRITSPDRLQRLVSSKVMSMNSKKMGA